MFTKNFIQLRKEDIQTVGGKGVSLGEMTRAGIPVPPGFVVTTNTFKKFSNSEISNDAIDEILTAFEKLGVERVAVRSSAVAEDSTQASWAGQLESYLNVSRDELIDRIRDCWNSIKTERALSYASQQNLNEADLVVAVVVQKMVEAQVAGVMFTVNPVTRNKDEVMIEACYGLGEMLVQGMIIPDNYIINVHSMEIVSKTIDTQETMLVFNDGKNQVVHVLNGNEATLTDDQVIALTKLGKIIEEHYEKPQDIEWAMEDNKFYIVQSRPITTL